MILLSGSAVTDDGFYLIREDGKLTVAEFCRYSEYSSEWRQIGINYDVWQYSEEIFKIEVICKLDLESIARNSAKAE